MKETLPQAPARGLDPGQKTLLAGMLLAPDPDPTTAPGEGLLDTDAGAPLHAPVAGVEIHLNTEMITGMCEVISYFSHSTS